MSKLSRRVFPVALALAASPGLACDLCAVYSAQLAQGQGVNGWYAGLSEQYTRYDELRSGSTRINDDGGQYLNSSVTQLLVGYGLSEHWSLQANLPYIDREYLRLEHDGARDRGSESGIGDLSVIAQYLAYERQNAQSSLSWRLLGGIKFGTGSSDRLAEELDEMAAAPKHEGEIPSGVHGHDLALGSGSTDWLIGSSLHARSARWIYTGEVQYALRTQGDYDYQIGNDLQWTLGGGRYLLLEDERTMALQLVLSGEHKHYDELAGARLGDTRAYALTIGPQLAATFGARYAIELQAAWPLDQDVSETQITQGWRLRGALLARF